MCFQSSCWIKKQFQNVCNKLNKHLLKLHFETAKDSKEIMESLTSKIRSYVYDDVIDFEVCGFTQQNLNVLRIKNFSLFFLSIKNSFITQ